MLSIRLLFCFLLCYSCLFVAVHAFLDRLPGTWLAGINIVGIDGRQERIHTMVYIHDFVIHMMRLRRWKEPEHQVTRIREILRALVYFARIDNLEPHYRNLFDELEALTGLGPPAT